MGKTDPWKEWDGTVSPKANFTSGTNEISGVVNTGISGAGITAADVALLSAINLNEAGKITNVGSGTWNYDFYGSAINSIPSGIAGDFATKRAKRDGGTFLVPQSDGSTKQETRTAITALEVQGAFGAHHVGQTLDDEQNINE